MSGAGWRCLSGAVSHRLQLSPTFTGGQSFRWKHNEDTDEWIGVFKNTAWKIRQDGDNLLYQVLGSLEHKLIQPAELTKEKCNNLCDGILSDESYTSFDALLKSYLRLDEDVDALYEHWSKTDALFASVAQKFYGVRMLSQDPVENLFSFICSSNNHISRISSMVEKLCTYYGERICETDGKEYYAFPSIKALCDEKVEMKLRELGFGYRAKFIHQSALKIHSWGGNDWFVTLTKMPYSEAKEELLKLPGVGPKVADCICLMSLNHLEAIPIDTHIYQITVNRYLHHLKGGKSLTKRIYDEIGDYFRNMYGSKAGWAHTVLFCADLKKFEEPGSKRFSHNEKNTVKKKKLK